MFLYDVVDPHRFTLVKMSAELTPRHWWRAIGPLQLFILAGLIGTLAVGGGSLFASERAGESEAIAEVQNRTELVASNIVEHHLTRAVLEGEQEALAEFDQLIVDRVLDESTLRIKLWDADGRIVYSDEPRLIGEQYALGSDEEASLRTGESVSELSRLEGPENRFERPLADELLEVYLPLTGPDGQPLLYESYFAPDAVAASSRRIRDEFTPIIVGALLIMEALHLGFAWALSRRLRRGQDERERLLQRAIESSDLERRRIALDLQERVVQDMVETASTVTGLADSAAIEQSAFAPELQRAAQRSQHSVRSLRSLLIDVAPPSLEEHGLNQALADLLAPATNLGIDADLTMTGAEAQSIETKTLVYRVVRESVRNVFRHANATQLSVRVESCAEATVATIVDNGTGFRPEEAGGPEPTGLGLLSELTRDAGALFEVGSKPGVGTEIRVEVSH